MKTVACLLMVPAAMTTLTSIVCLATTASLMDAAPTARSAAALVARPRVKLARQSAETSACPLTERAVRTDSTIVQTSARAPATGTAVIWARIAVMAV